MHHSTNSARKVRFWLAFAIVSMIAGLLCAELRAADAAPTAAGTWQYLTNGSYAWDTALLLTDGTVMVQSTESSIWYRLSPDSSGSYLNGTWSQLASMHDTRLYYASAVMPDGRVFVGGGEYGSGGSTVEIYDPVANTWTYVTSWPGGDIGDSTAKVLADGRVLLLPRLSGGGWIYNPVTDTWKTIAGRLYGGNNDEESVLQLPDGSFLSLVANSSSAERYIPSHDQWVAAGSTPTNMWAGYEIGPGCLLYDGRVLFLGATGATALYTPTSNSWQSGPVIPSGFGCDDAPGAVMPNGHVLFIADSGNYSGPSAFFEFDPVSSSMTNVAGPSGGPSFLSRMLVLPTGQVLSDGSIYTPVGGPNAAWQPTISSITQNSDGSYKLTGTQLNGLTEGAYYGDDAQMSSNYPIVRLVSGSNVYYARSFAFSTMGVATGSATVSANFSVAGIPNGTYSLYAVANGIASNAVSFTISTAAFPAITSALSASGTVGAPFTYAITASNNPASFNATGLPAGLSVNTASGVISGTPTAAGSFSVTISAANASGTGSATLALTINAPAESPYLPGGGVGAPWPIPGQIEAENYDNGGEGVAYHDSDAVNSGGAYRTDGVDIEACSDAGGGYDVGWIYPGEWLQYTVNVAAAGAYDIQARVASPASGGAFHIELNGINVSGPMTVPATGGWETWQTIAASNVTLSAGQQYLRIAFDSNGSSGYIGNLNWINVVAHAQAPVITAQPNNQTVTAGQTATFTVAATGTAPLAYQWQENGTNIGGATSASYTTPATTTADSGSTFQCVVSNSAGSTTSNAATLMVNSAVIPPSITTQPGNQTVAVGQAATFSVVATGSAPLAYQWQMNGTNISGATSASYTTPATTAADGGSTFQCVVSNSAGSVTSNAATLTVTAAVESPYGGTPWPIPGQIEAENYDNGGEGVAYHDTDAVNSGGAFRTDGVDIEACSDAGGGYDVGWIYPGEWLNYTVNVAAAGAYDIQARVASPGAGGNFHIEMNGANVSGAMTIPATGGWQTWQTIAASNVNLSAGQQYLRIVFDSNGGSGYVGNLNWINIVAHNQLIAPTITTQPGNQTATAGQTATFSVTATGSAPLAYQWQKNGTNIGGATSASYTMPATMPADSGSTFQCVVSNAAGSVTSNAATLTVNNGTPVITSPAFATPNPAAVGQSVALTAAANDADGDALTYSWAFGDGGTATGATATHAYAAAGNYTATVTVSDPAGATASSPVTVTVNAAAKTLHVAGIAMTLNSTSKGKAGIATVTIKDGNGVVVSSAVVSGTWSGLTSAGVSGNTGSAGTVKFTSARTKTTGAFTFTITNAAAQGYTYAASQNVATSGSITTSGVVTLKPAAPASDGGAIDLVGVIENRTFKLALPLPASMPPSTRIRASATGLPAGVRVSGGFIGGKPPQSGTFTFTVNFQARVISLGANGKKTASTVQTSQQYTLTVLP